jgi:peroxiredoxin family protein
VVFSGDLDKAIAALIIATGAASIGMEASIFYTFWGLGAVKKQKNYDGKSLLERGFTAMLPAGTGQLGFSQMNFFGAGAQIIRKLMRERGVASIEELFGLAQELGVRMVVCDMSRELLGVHDGELMDSPGYRVTHPMCERRAPAVVAAAPRRQLAALQAPRGALDRARLSFPGYRAPRGSRDSHRGVSQVCGRDHQPGRHRGSHSAGRAADGTLPVCECGVSSQVSSIAR